MFQSGTLRGPILCLAVLLGLVLPGVARAEAVTVFAAASLKTALDEIAALYTAETGQKVVASHAGSSALARQIQQGAPADLFVSASPDWMDQLQDAGRIDAASRFDLAGNRLVLIAHDAQAAPLDIGPEMDLSDRLEGGRLAMALVDAVPAGIYGKAALQQLGQWRAVAPHVAQADNVRAALALVATGAAPLGIVYATDAAVEPRVRVLGRFPDGSHPPIRYPAAAVAGRTGEAAAFLSHLRGAAAQEVLARHGFVPVTE